jgi:predicted enzyme related to lactoylglutathione lyase
VPKIERIGNVFYCVRDMDAALDFYTQKLGLPLKFRDGSRWAALDVGGMTLALSDGGQPGAPGGATVSLRAEDLDGLLAQLRERGATGLGEVKTGPHERTVELTDPSGNKLLLYEPLPRQ